MLITHRLSAMFVILLSFIISLTIKYFENTIYPVADNTALLYEHLRSVRENRNIFCGFRIV